MKAGTFNSYPSHSADLYVTHHSKPTHQEPIFHPPPGPKSTPVKSIITVNVNRLILVSVIYFTFLCSPMFKDLFTGDSCVVQYGDDVDIRSTSQ